MRRGGGDGDGDGNANAMREEEEEAMRGEPEQERNEQEGKKKKTKEASLPRVENEGRPIYLRIFCARNTPILCALLPATSNTTTCILHPFVLVLFFFPIKTFIQIFLVLYTL